MKYCLFGILFLVSGTCLFSAGSPILERKISIKVVNQTLSKTLGIISEAGGFHFSYSSSVLKPGRVVSVQAENKTVKEILDHLFKEALTYQQIGNHLILQKKPVPRHTGNIQGNSGKPVKYNYIISGYIRDEEHGNGIALVSVYEKQSLSSAVSGDFGYFQLSVNHRSPEIELKFSHTEYRDTTMRVQFQNQGLADGNISLKPKTIQKEISTVDSPDLGNKVEAVVQKNDTPQIKPMPEDTVRKKLKVEDTRAGRWLIGTVQRLNEKNIRDSFSRKWQFTLIPPLASNGNLSGLVENKLSVNVLAGYNGSLHGVEFGGLLNALKNDMKGIQFAGLGNVVGRSTKGCQFAGIFNHNLGSVNVFQAAGLYNYNHFDASAVQLAGLCNVNRGELQGVQAAGLLNVAPNANGIQLSGFMNYSGAYSHLVQVAGFMNVAHDIEGGQLSGFINRARNVKGFQIGLINIADTVQGISLGIINIIKSGLHQLEFSCNEAAQYGIAYRSGTDAFYSNVLLSSQMPGNDSGNLITYGYGIGHNFRISRSIKLNADISCQQQTIDFRSDFLNLQNRLNLNLEIKLLKGVSVFGGASLNHSINNTLDPQYESRFRDFGGKIVWSEKVNDFVQKAWWGYQFGIRFF